MGRYGYNRDVAAAEIQKSVRYEKFKDITDIELKHALNLPIDQRAPDVLMLNVHYHCPGQDSSCRPKEVVLSFTAVSAEFQFLGHRGLTLMLDGERVVPGQPSWDGEVPDHDVGRTWETMNVSVPVPVFEKIVNAKTVQGRLGQWTFRLEPQYLTALRDLFDFLRQPDQRSHATAKTERQSGRASAGSTAGRRASAR